MIRIWQEKLLKDSLSIMMLYGNCHKRTPGAGPGERPPGLLVTMEISTKYSLAIGNYPS